MKSLFVRKSVIASTGIFLCLFLIVHLSANFILLFPESIAREWYNAYSTLLRESPIIKVVAYALYLSIVLHAICALLITLHNQKAKPQAYEVNHHYQNSSWSSQNMGALGVVILIFIVVHLANFWAKIKLGIGEQVPLDEFGNTDVYGVTYALFQNVYYVIFYALTSIPLALHLHHGMKSAFKSLGFYHQKGLQVLARISLVYAVIMGLGFGIIPIVVYFK